MWSLPFLTVSSLALIQSFVVGLTLPSNEAQIQRMKRSVNAQTQQELARVIGGDATIFGPTDANWGDATVRREGDVAKIVRYANNHNIPFYAVSRGHALTTSVGRFTGIEIDMSNLKDIRINPNNATAQFQGGVYSYEVINTLWDQGFVTGIIGPALGGGHGLQKGRHGMTSDHLVNMNVVLADGSAIRVNEKSHPDLWWAMRGAGHNFGIVTSFESKIWPDNFKSYFVRVYQFGSSSLDALVGEVNKFQGVGTLDPTWLASFGLYTMNTTLSKTEATIIWVFIYDGAQKDAEPVLKPFDQLRPLSVDDFNVPYKSINNLIGGAVDGSLCQPDKTHIIGTANLQTYNVTSMRAIYDLYNQKISQQPELGGTRILVEGYAVRGVRSFKPEDSAFPQRDEYILTYFDVTFNSTDDPRIGFATEWRDQTVALWNAGQPTRKPTTYVNYAAGYESLEARYGFEPWRLDRLRKLKKKYDPKNRFAWYNPIVPPR
ncbi:MAG: hypothetical protein Q9178_006927 [Gyalolechia marmorata]